MEISIADHFNYKNIFRFTLPPILMMLFTSLYGIVDGFFISNYAGIDEYAGVNVIMPIVMIIGGIGFMFGTGGSALTGMYLGQQNKKKANESFTMILISIIVVGLLFSALGFIFIKPIANALGSITNGTTENMVNEAIKYGRVICLGQVFFMLQSSFQSYLVVDEKPRLGFLATCFAGIANMILDFFFIAIFKWGVIGAAIATVIGYIIGSMIPFIHFLKNDSGNIKLVKTKIDFKVIGKACFNGSSEFVNNISSSIVGLVYNIQLLRYYGQDGVSAYGTLMYVSFLFVAVFVGYAIGMAPVISYNYGANNKKEMSSVLRKSMLLVGICSVLMLIAGEILGPLFSKAYVGQDEELLELTIYAFKIFSIQFIFCGFSIYFSSFFTALNNGLISALISFLRTLVFQIIFVIFLPLLFGKELLWWAVVFSEIAACILSFIFLFANSKKYGYFSK